MPNDTLNSVGAFVPLTAERMRSKTSLKKLVRGAVQSNGLRKGTINRYCDWNADKSEEQGHRPSIAWLNKKQSRKEKVKRELVTEKHIVVCGMPV